ncbi:MAG: hypothetical protein LBT05_02740 [Planctomycetaceae bacterium]|nr:hypothetical protein [Planctomycetaceae bacterium]
MAGMTDISRRGDRRNRDELNIKVKDDALVDPELLATATANLTAISLSHTNAPQNEELADDSNDENAAVSRPLFAAKAVQIGFKILIFPFLCLWRGILLAPSLPTKIYRGLGALPETCRALSQNVWVRLIFLAKPMKFIGMVLTFVGAYVGVVWIGKKFTAYRNARRVAVEERELEKEILAEEAAQKAALVTTQHQSRQNGNHTVSVSYQQQTKHEKVATATTHYDQQQNKQSQPQPLSQLQGKPQQSNLQQNFSQQQADNEQEKFSEALRQSEPVAPRCAATPHDILTLSTPENIPQSDSQYDPFEQTSARWGFKKNALFAVTCLIVLVGGLLVAKQFLNKKNTEVAQNEPESAQHCSESDLQQRTNENAISSANPLRENSAEMQNQIPFYTPNADRPPAIEKNASNDSSNGMFFTPPENDVGVSPINSSAETPEWKYSAQEKATTENNAPNTYQEPNQNSYAAFSNTGTKEQPQTPPTEIPAVNPPFNNFANSANYDPPDALQSQNNKTSEIGYSAQLTPRENSIGENTARTNPPALSNDSNFADFAKQDFLQEPLQQTLTPAQPTALPTSPPQEFFSIIQETPREATMQPVVSQTETARENPLTLSIEQSETQRTQTPFGQITTEPEPVRQPMMLSNQDETIWTTQNPATSETTASLAPQPQTATTLLQPGVALQNAIENTPRTSANHHSINNFDQPNPIALLMPADSASNHLTFVSPTQQAIAMPTVTQTDTQTPPVHRTEIAPTSSALPIIAPFSAVSQNLTEQISGETASYSNSNNYSAVTAQMDVPTASYAALVSPPQLQTASGTRNYIVKEGDSIFTIAKRELNNVRRFREIYELNRDRISLQKTTLTAGTALLLPVDL